MADAKGLFEWQQTSSLESLTINMNRDSKHSKVVHPDELNPFVKKKDIKKNRINGKAAWALFKQVVENTMAKQK